MARILVLEDDKLFNETLEDFLEEEGHSIHCALDPYSALDLTYEYVFDLYLFDVNLPYENGFELLEKLRQSGDETPCIFITSREDKASLQQGFEKGGDDYIRKPVDLDELFLRMQAVLRRQVRSQIVQMDTYQFDILTKTLYQNDKAVELSIKGSELLLTLLEGQGRVVPLEQIKERLWSSAEEASDGALRVYIAQLKKYFPTQIQNIRGVGYQMSIK
ncbi:MAG: response regulator transcription factor [Sulfurovum sp.]|uniref:response regulator transcription factor n=1 Tax=Sulfurovum sp. TaxID=1969726 RepID=UPI002867F989|nr:response regulator transcription factor [Sulfurovum sp.]MCO4846187.1 response regulator transcription factor [Sulfurovum sp.]